MAKHSLQAIVHKTVALRNNVVLLEACSVGWFTFIFKFQFVRNMYNSSPMMCLKMTFYVVNL